jgi:hypothetical protein
VNDSEVGIKTRQIRNNDDSPQDSNIVLERKETLSIRVVSFFVFLLFNIPAINVAEAPTAKTIAVNIEDSILSKLNASEKTIVVK